MKIQWLTGAIALGMAIYPYATSPNPMMEYRTPTFAYDMIGGVLVIITVILFLRELWKNA